MLVRRWGELNVVAGLARVLLVLDVNPGSTTALLLLLLELTLQETGGVQNTGAHQSKTRQNSSSNASDGLLLMLWVNHTVQSYNVTPAQAMHQMVRANHTFL